MSYCGNNSVGGVEDNRRPRKLVCQCREVRGDFFACRCREVRQESDFDWICRPRENRVEAAEDRYCDY
ncbi:hypothetical protein [Bacillus niameyensis]|uniref:hypothetical protein n=1 Tax=Bacillus niameyensis TaxID=1522308 RepID=UPI0007842E1E|nr:hypothetical protein [Bacillus niameyensis]